MQNNRMWLVAAISAVFILFAIGGSVITSRQMNMAADQHAGSAGRPGDPAPNVRQEKNDPPATAPAPGSSTNGANAGAAAPTAPR
jgi:hypothetical protein